MRRLLSIAIVAGFGCRRAPAMPPPGNADQSVRDAVVLVCDAPARAESETRKGVSTSDAISMHLTDGVGNDRVLTTVEGWKTNGIDARALDALTTEAKVKTCALRSTVGGQ